MKNSNQRSGFRKFLLGVPLVYSIVSCNHYTPKEYGVEKRFDEIRYIVNQSGRLGLGCTFKFKRQAIPGATEQVLPVLGLYDLIKIHRWDPLDGRNYTLDKLVEFGNPEIEECLRLKDDINKLFRERDITYLSGNLYLRE